MPFLKSIVGFLLTVLVILQEYSAIGLLPPRMTGSIAPRVPLNPEPRKSPRQSRVIHWQPKSFVENYLWEPTTKPTTNFQNPISAQRSFLPPPTPVTPRRPRVLQPRRPRVLQQTPRAPVFRPPPTLPNFLPPQQTLKPLPRFRAPPVATTTMVPPTLPPTLPPRPTTTPPPQIIIVTMPPQVYAPVPLVSTSCSCKKGYSFCPPGSKKVGDCEEEGQEGSWCCGYEM